MQPTNERPQVKFAEPDDVSLDTQLQSGEFESAMVPATAGSTGNASYEYEAIALMVMGLGLFALALIIVLARSIKRTSSKQ
jgi:hypothetical protein